MHRLIIIVGAWAMLAACYRANTPAPGPEPRWQLYDIAWSRGLSDRLTPLPYDWTRYKAKLAPFADVPERETIFSSGYDDGFHQHPEEERDVSEMAYDGGYRSGRLDAWNHKPANDLTDTFDHEIRRRGYADGFNSRPHAYGRPY